MPVRAVRLAAIVLALALALPALAAAQDRDAECALLSRTGDHFSRAPLPGLDPNNPAPISIPKPEGSTALVLCRRGTIVPQPSDWRVPAEAGLPLDLTDERRVLELAIVAGKLQASFRRGQPSAREQQAVTEMVEQMQAAMQGAPAAR
jgi:hypothetical protein